MKPRLSIITVCRNARRDLLKTQKSIFGQSCNDFEWIVIDGDSHDGTVDELRLISDARLRFISEKDTGIYDAMNKGLAMASGEWVWFLNAGDIFFAEVTVEAVLSAADRKVQIVYGDALFVDGKGNAHGLRSEITPHRLPSELCKKDFRLGMLISHQSFVMRRALALPFESDRFRYSADLDWMLRVLEKPRTCCRLDEPLSRILRDGVTMRYWKRSQWERFLILSGHFGFHTTLLNHARIANRRIWHGLRTRFWR
jgi:glycosyltransferase involved in cell wall biosynthesis